MIDRSPSGVLPDFEIAALIEAGALALSGPIAPRQLQPASLDLTIGRRGWRARASFLPSRGKPFVERLQDGLMMHELDLTKPVVFERGCVYVVELAERLKLPANICGAANPKSSTGRIDVFVRLVADGGCAFDEIPAGYEGPLYAEISPRTFSIVARPGSSLNQLRFKRGECRLSDDDLKILHARAPLIDAEADTLADIDGGVGLCVRLAGAPGEIVGWRGRRHAALIDVDKAGALAAEDFFEPIAAPKSGFIILDPDEFYILASEEALTAPPDCAAEMTPIDPGLGEFRVHYAGFFDPGFGWPKGSRAVLEVRSHDAPFVLEHKQLVARLAYERMAARPKRLYGEGLSSHYQGQGLKLSKHFK